MGDSTPDVSVIIVSYNTMELLGQCLRSLVEETQDLRLEIIVIDNASVDDSVLMIREQFAATRLIANIENVGFARATNQGILASSGRYVLLLNPDTIVLDRAIERMVTFLDSHPGRVLVVAS